jgi:hypothetical protein
VLTVRARIPRRAGYSPVLPVVIPDLSEVKAFANHLHAAGKHWQGEMFGWPTEYTPESRKKPSGSKMRFTPADFCIGESGIWFYSLMWEHGKNKPPVEFLDDRGIVKDQKPLVGSR